MIDLSLKSPFPRHCCTLVCFAHCCCHRHAAIRRRRMPPERLGRHHHDWPIDITLLHDIDAFRHAWLTAATIALLLFFRETLHSGFGILIRSTAVGALSEWRKGRELFGRGRWVSRLPTEARSLSKFSRTTAERRCVSTLCDLNVSGYFAREHDVLRPSRASL
jgi:hypothetical protein